MRLCHHHHHSPLITRLAAGRPLPCKTREAVKIKSVYTSAFARHRQIGVCAERRQPQEEKLKKKEGIWAISRQKSLEQPQAPSPPVPVLPTDGRAAYPVQYRARAVLASD